MKGICMKFLFFTDTHIRGTSPRNRKDNFFEALKNKFNEIKQIVDENEIDYILHGGDWFDRPDISPSVVREFAILIKGFNKPIFSIAGNHDIYGHNPDTIDRTMLGILESIDLFKLLKYEEVIVLEKNGIRVQITGKAYNYDIDGEDFKKYYIVKKQEDVDFAINMVHGMLLTKPFFEGIQYTLLEDIQDTEADITLAGHYHSGFGIVNKLRKDAKTDQYFINPGSLVRITNTLTEIERRPKVIIIDVQKEIFIKEVEIVSALPGDEILDRTQMEKNLDRNQKLHHFYQGVTASGEYNHVNMNDIIDEIASNHSLDREVKEEAVRRIAIARENISSGDDS